MASGVRAVRAIRDYGKFYMYLIAYMFYTGTTTEGSQ